MENLDILLLLTAIIIGITVTKEIFSISGNTMSSTESERFFNNLSNANNEDPSIKSAIYTRGLSLNKSKNSEKYDLIPQSKLCDLGLS